MPERKARGADRLIGRPGAHLDEAPTHVGAPAALRGEGVAEHGRVHDADDGDAVFDQRDRHAHDRELVQEVGGAVEGVDEPSQRAALTALFLAEHGDVGEGIGEDGSDRPLAGGVGLAHPVAREALGVDGMGAAERVAHDLPTRVRSRHGSVEERVEIHSVPRRRAQHVGQLRRRRRDQGAPRVGVDG